jgi:Rrf2 family protein
MLKLSQKADYALRAMLELARSPSPEGLARTAEVARRTRAPEKFLEAILGELGRAGLVESRRGAAGGHRLARAPGSITLGEVWRAVEGPISRGGRGSRRGPAPDAGARALGDLWAEVEESVAQVVDGTTLEDLAQRASEFSKVQDFTI